MGKQYVTYRFGRLNLVGEYDDKEQFLLHGLRSNRYMFYRNYTWGFFHVSTVEVEGQRYIHGFLVKYRPSSDEEIANPYDNTLEGLSVKNRVGAKARFFLHVKTGVIAFHPVGNRMNPRTFIERFEALFERGHDNMFVNAEIQSIEERFQIFEDLKKFERITKLCIYLHPSNPSAAREWERVDERIRALHATSYTEVIETKGENATLNLLEDAESKSKITMAEDGYGKAEVTGEIDGKPKTISTENRPITSSAPGDWEGPGGVLEWIKETFREIFRRII